MIEGQDLATGRFKAGNQAGGRKALPKWFTEKEEAMLRMQYDAAMTGRMPVDPDPEAEPELADDGTEVRQGSSQEVPAALRLETLERLLNRIRGRPGIAQGEGGDAMNEFMLNMAKVLAGEP